MLKKRETVTSSLEALQKRSLTFKEQGEDLDLEYSFFQPKEGLFSKEQTTYLRRYIQSFLVRLMTLQLTIRERNDRLHAWRKGEATGVSEIEGYTTQILDQLRQIYNILPEYTEFFSYLSTIVLLIKNEHVGWVDKDDRRLKLFFAIASINLENEITIWPVNSLGDEIDSAHQEKVRRLTDVVERTQQHLQSLDSIGSDRVISDNAAKMIELYYFGVNLPAQYLNRRPHLTVLSSINSSFSKHK